MFKQIVSVVGEEVRFGVTMLQHQMTGNTAEKAKVLVNGSPKTGTTWMLKLISSLPGYENVGNFYREHEKYDAVQPGHTIHGHEVYTDALKKRLDQNGIRVILMLRDPRDQLISRTFHVRRSENHAWHERMQHVELDQAIMMCIEGREGLPPLAEILALTESWLAVPDSALVVRYEEMLADPVPHFMRVLAYLGIPENRRLAEVIVERNRFARLSIGKRIWQTQRKPGQEDTKSHFRKGIAGDWRNYMNAEHIARFKELCGRQLIELGYERDLDWE